MLFDKMFCSKLTLNVQKLSKLACRPQSSNFHTTFFMGAKSKNHYETLNLPNNCSSKEIREAFISLSKQYHPDKNEGSVRAQEQFVKVSEAYNVLSNPSSRRDYDSSLYHQYSGPSQAYRSTHKTDYYNVYRDPWKDPSFARNRKYSQEDDYYSKTGMKKPSHEQLVRSILVFFAVGLFLQIMFVRFASIHNLAQMNQRSDQNREYLKSVKERAESYETRERQIEEAKRRFGLYSQE